jgi:two-component system, cell cycle sensor histidine kinase and response regulator CckA
MAASSERPAPRVLIVDDEESIRTFSERALKGAGYDVVSASDGRDALVVAEEKGPFDLFLVDIMMPEMPGDELGRRLRQLDADAKVLYFTGYADHLFKERITLWQNEAYIDKPVSIQGLLEAVSLSLFGHTRGLRTGH